MTQIKLHKADELSTAEGAALQALTDAVYPPEVLANLPGLAIEWAPAQWRVICWSEDGQALSHTGVLLRDGKVDETPVTIGGIGGVKTHPNHRNQGLAANTIRRALYFLRDREVDFALLVCDKKLVPLYERLGWRLYDAPLIVTQKGERVRFTFNVPMICEVSTDGPAHGAIDLLGPPW